MMPLPLLIEVSGMVKVSNCRSGFGNVSCVQVRKIADSAIQYAVFEKNHQRICIVRRIFISASIEVWIKLFTGLSIFHPAIGEVVLQRVDLGLDDISIFLSVEVRTEIATSNKQALHCGCLRLFFDGFCAHVCYLSISRVSQFLIASRSWFREVLISVVEMAAVRGRYTTSQRSLRKSNLPSQSSPITNT